jgi:hypothetical protein
VPIFLKQTLVSASETKTLSCIIQLSLGSDEICGFKALAKGSIDLAECRARVGGIVLQLGLWFSVVTWSAPSFCEMKEDEQTR